MNRKLHNTASSVLVIGTLGALGLAVALSGPTGTTARSAATAGAAAASVSMVALETASLPPRQGPRRSSRIRHSMAMPFFSFASRG